MAAVGILMVLLTAVAAPILALSAVYLSNDGASLNAFDKAPVCAAGKSAAASTASCKQEVEYHVASEDGHAGHDSVWYLYLTDSSAAQTRIQLVSDKGVWPAADGEPVTVTSWRGGAVSVSDGRNTSPLVGSPLRSGDSPYQVLWIVGAVYVFVLLFVLIRRAPGPLLLVPTAMAIAGIALRGRFIGGSWAGGLLLDFFAGFLLLIVSALIAARLQQRRG